MYILFAVSPLKSDFVWDSNSIHILSEVLSTRVYIVDDTYPVTDTMVAAPPLSGTSSKSAEHEGWHAGELKSRIVNNDI